jgi:hypothetical protein
MPSRQWIAEAADALVVKLGPALAIEVAEELQKVPGANKQTKTALDALHAAVVWRAAV